MCLNELKENFQFQYINHKNDGCLEEKIKWTDSQ